MKYWIILDNRQLGPFELEEIKQYPVMPNTPVWHEGLAQWIPASRVPEIVNMFAPPEPEPPITYDHQATDNDGYGERNEHEQQPQTQRRPGNHRQIVVDNRMAERPSSYLGWAIAATILCCVPLGIIAIVFAAQVNSKWERGDYEGALKASKRAEIWIILAITLGVVLAPFSLFINQ